MVIGAVMMGNGNGFADATRNTGTHVESDLQLPFRWLVVIMFRSFAFRIRVEHFKRVDCLGRTMFENFGV